MFFYRKENIWWKQIITVLNNIKKQNVVVQKNTIKKIESKLQELMIRAYPVTVNDINDEIWATNKNN